MVLDDSQKKGRPSVFDPHGSGLDECMVVVVSFPVSFVAVPIALGRVIEGSRLKIQENSA
jgi:hypothetical protein